MAKAKAVLILIIIGFTFWFGLNGVMTPVIVMFGAITTLITVIFFTKLKLFSTIKLNIPSLIALLQWLIVFIIAIIQSNIDVISRVLSPKLRINPGIVKVQTKLKTKLGRLLLANSITLTPGTLTVDIKEDNLYIHWIDVESTNIEEATKKIVQKFEKYLEVSFG